MANFVSKYTGAQHDEAVRLTGELDGKVTKLSEEMVKTINGVEPDENGNIQIEGGASVAVDDTLTESGKAADAKAVGDEITAIKNAAFDIVTGKNLVNSATNVVGLIQESGQISPNNAYANYYTSDFIAIKSNTDYTLTTWNMSNLTIAKFRKAYLLFDADKNLIPGGYANISSTESITFNSESASYVRVSSYVVNEDTGKVSRVMQLEEGAAYTPYEPYNASCMVLKNSDVTPDILRGKKWAVFGDSFTDGARSGLLTEGKYQGRRCVYPYIIGNRTDMEIIRFFESGRTLAYPANPGDFTNSVTNPASAAYYQNVPEDVDYITIYLGINDGHHASGDSGTDGESTEGVIPIGTIDDDTTSTYYGAWNVVLPWLMEHRPFAHIGILVSNGCDSDDYRLAQIAIAKKYGIPYIDLNGDEHTPAMIRTTNPDIPSAVKTLIKKKQAVDYDGTVTGSENHHPNDAAHEFESRFIENFLRSI